MFCWTNIWKMSARAARALLICSALVAATVHDKSNQNFDDSTKDLSSTRYSAQHAIINGFNNENRANPYPVNNINLLSTSQSVSVGRPLPRSRLPIRHISQTPPAPSQGKPFNYKLYHQEGYLRAGAIASGRPVYEPVSFDNIPATCLLPWQPPITSKAPHPPIHYYCAPVILHATEILYINEPIVVETITQPPLASITQIEMLTACEPGSKRDFLDKCREDFQVPSQPSFPTNKDDCKKGFVKDPTGRCRKVVDLFG